MSAPDYYRIIQTPDLEDGRPVIVEMWYGDYGHDEQRFLTDLEFATEDAAKLWLYNMRELCRRLGDCE